MTQKFKKIIQIIITTATILAILAYLLACLAPLLNAGRHTYFALIGLIFPLLFFALIGFLIFWLTRKSKWVFICIAALLCGWQQVSVLIGFHPIKKFNVAKAPETLRVLTWNLSSWGESNRSGIPKGQDNYQSEMVEVIKNSNADVLCFQEYLYYKNSQYLDSVIPALKEMGYQYLYFAKKDYTGYLYTTVKLTGIEIISKYPIAEADKFLYNDNMLTEPLIYADIIINNQRIRFFTTHLESVRFGSEDYEVLHKLKDPTKLSISKSRNAGGKLKIAYRKRALQAELLQEKIKASPFPVIVCGDFNDVPNSYTYFTIKGDLQDAFLKKGWGFGKTFRYISPTLRIDYILADKKFAVSQFNKIEVPYSDHYPIIADFDITERLK